MTILSQALFALVSGHLVTFSFLSAGHLDAVLELIKYCCLKVLSQTGLLHIFHEHLSGLESGDLVLGDDDGSILGDVAGSLL